MMIVLCVTTWCLACRTSRTTCPLNNPVLTAWPKLTRGRLAPIVVLTFQSSGVLGAQAGPRFQPFGEHMHSDIIDLFTHTPCASCVGCRATLQVFYCPYDQSYTHVYIWESVKSWPGLNCMHVRKCQKLIRFRHGTCDNTLPMIIHEEIIQGK